MLRVIFLIELLVQMLATGLCHVSDNDVIYNGNKEILITLVYLKFEIKHFYKDLNRM